MDGSRRLLAGVVALGILSVLFAPVSQAEPACAAATREQAKSLADELYRQGLYQRAGECYQVAGDPADANEAFVKAVRPNSDVTAKDLEHQGQIAKALFTGVQQAFHTNH
jgi:hypothetical protein